MNSTIVHLAAAVTVAVVETTVWAISTTPVGAWRTIDDNTGKERSIVRISEVNGELQGVVEKIFDRPGEDSKHLCNDCRGDRQGKPIIGMTILWGLKQNDDEWTGGEILDPDNGKTYRCKMTLSEDGKQLKVRGFIGISLIGRTQTWQRE